MATPEENIEASAPPPSAAPVVEPPPEEAVAAAVEEISKEIKGEEEKKGEGDLKSTLLISGAVVAVIGAILAIFKKVKGSAA